MGTAREEEAALGPSISAVKHPEDVSCAFCGRFKARKAQIDNQHEGVGSLICEFCVNALDAFFNNLPPDPE